MDEFISPSVWKKVRSQAGQILGEDFWEDVSQFFPRQGPRTDLYRTDRELVAIVELPGLKSADSLNVACSGRILHVSGETAYNYPIPEDELILSERLIGRFSRKIPLPEAVVPHDVQARYQQGLLIIRLTVAPDLGNESVSVEFDDKA